MTPLSLKELYALFLESDWWKALSFRKRKACGFVCQRCGREDYCQAHHVRYPENWFDTTESDLECICRECHEREHHLNGSPKPPSVRPVSTAGLVFGSMRSVAKARSRGEITREEFKELKKKFQNKPRKRRRKSRNWKRKAMEIPKQWGAQRPYRMGIYKHHHWVNRGTSSN